MPWRGRVEHLEIKRIPIHADAESEFCKADRTSPAWPSVVAFQQHRHTLPHADAHGADGVAATGRNELTGGDRGEETEHGLAKNELSRALPSSFGRGL
jgi:hypothetical protein